MTQHAPRHGSTALHRWSARLALLALLLHLLVLPVHAWAAAGHRAVDLPFGDAAALCLAAPENAPGAPGSADGTDAPPGAYCPVCLSIHGAAALLPQGIAVAVAHPAFRPLWSRLIADARPAERSAVPRTRGPPLAG